MAPMSSLSGSGAWITQELVKASSQSYVQQIDVELQIKRLTLTSSPKADLTETSVLLGITGNQLRCSGQKGAWKGVTYDMLFLKPEYHHHLVKMFYTSSKIILNVTSVH